MSLQRVIQILVVIGCFVGSTVGIDAVLPWVDVTNMFLIGKLCALILDYFSRGKDKLILRCFKPHPAGIGRMRFAVLKQRSAARPPKVHSITFPAWRGQP